MLKYVDNLRAKNQPAEANKLMTVLVGLLTADRSHSESSTMRAMDVYSSSGRFLSAVTATTAAKEFKAAAPAPASSRERPLRCTHCGLNTHLVDSCWIRYPHLAPKNREKVEEKPVVKKRKTRGGKAVRRQKKKRGSGSSSSSSD